MFADVLVIALLRFIRRLFRIHQAKQWPQTSATLIDWTCIDADREYSSGWSSLQIQGVFEYLVSGEKFVGLIKSVGLKEGSAWKYIDEVPKPTTITVRYNPLDPSQNRVLNEDNDTALGFDIATYETFKSLLLP